MRRICTGLLIGLVSSCATLPKDVDTVPYSSLWPPLRSEISCAEFGSIYENAGKSATPMKNGVEKAWLLSLVGLAPAVHGAVKGVQIMPEGANLSFIALNHTGSAIATKSLPCWNGELVLNNKGEHYVDGSTSNWTQSITFSLAQDGSLIAHIVGHVESKAIFQERSREYDVFYRFVKMTPQAGF